MADTLFEKLVKQAEVADALSEEICIKLTSDELANLMKKAETAKVSKEELLRQYILSTPAFDMSYFSPKKAKSKRGE